MWSYHWRSQRKVSCGNFINRNPSSVTAGTICHRGGQKGEGEEGGARDLWLDEVEAESFVHPHLRRRGQQTVSGEGGERDSLHGRRHRVSSRDCHKGSDANRGGVTEEHRRGGYREVEQVTASVVAGLESVLWREYIGATVNHHEVHDLLRGAIFIHPTGEEGGVRMAQPGEVPLGVESVSEECVHLDFTSRLNLSAGAEGV
jgi:hypothetical protein